MRHARVPWAYSFAVNERKTWRQRLGHHLRWLADRIDGRRSAAIQMSTTPPLSRREELEIIQAGWGHMQVLLEAAAKLEALEVAGRAVMPDLWDDARNEM